MSVSLLTLKQGENALDAGVVMESGDQVFGPIFNDMEQAQAFLKWHGKDPRLDGVFDEPTTMDKFYTFMVAQEKQQNITSTKREVNAVCAGTPVLRLVDKS
jgi:hypothetical protein|tara:strand:- start:183 stop:485 length:303 start_codon:yes stop_codon:yes gene_type:complete